MRVLLNCTSAVGVKTGIGHYINELYRCLQQQAPGAVDGYFPGPVWRTLRGSWAYVRALLESRESPAAVSVISKTPASSTPPVSWRTSLATKLHHGGKFLLGDPVHSYLRKHGHDLYHEPNFLPVPCSQPIITTVHDLSVLLHPEWHPPDRVAYFERNFQAGVARTHHFLAISETGRHEIIRHLGISPDRVTRTYMGIRPGLKTLSHEDVQASLRELGLPPRYLLYLGTLEPRKNVLTILRAYCRLPQSVRSACPLMLAGGVGWKAGDVLRYLDEEAKERGVIRLGYLPEQHVPAIYNGAVALLFPTFYEGFGLPPIEMLACGGAVIASTAGAIAETVGKKAHLVDPRDFDGWHDAMLRVATDDDWRQELRRGAEEVARPFTWEQCAADTLVVYRKVYAETRSAAA